MKKILVVLIFSILISIPVILPFFKSGYFPTHDGEWAVVRLSDMFRTLRDFQIPARYSGNLNFGFGYPLFNFTYPFPYYLGTLIHLLGIGFVDTIKILFAGSVLLSALFMFLASSALWGNKWAGVISGILYIYYPYRMVDLFVRGSLGESLSFVLFPILFYLAIKFVEKINIFIFCAISIAIGILIMTHNIMVVLFLPIFIVFVLSQITLKKKKIIKLFIISIFLGFGLSSFFWVPAIFEKSNILLSKIPIADRSLYYVKLDQFLIPDWGYGAPIDPNGFSYQLGLSHLAILIIAILFVSYSLWKKNFKNYFIKTASLLIAVSFFYIFLLFEPSDFLWKNIPLLSEINYPWISLGVLGFIISLLGGFLHKFIVGKYIAITISIVSLFLVFSYAKPEYYVNRGDSFYLTNDATTTSSNELMPIWVKSIPQQRAENKVEIVKGEGELQNISATSKEISFSSNFYSDGIIRLNTIYYPGWKVYIDDQNTSVSYENEFGVMDISISKGSHNINASFEETTLRMVSNIISLFSFLILLLFVINKNKLNLLDKSFK